ncbi:ferredoxin [Amycolatopsis sp. FDAARGOS 1241]|uniref:ferredoxin n=1 Tax=Amycolatopsis sp. FDAARGOS 1241 TaxID=2778070 RepID=UPI001950EDBC|nr:ferredoxin [Amycolatopsis sp. FDAARGOS 1241]QRP49356.1 ferredoxin [Amycolatopsis sp. FDAARGOS 1241]
MSEISTDQTRCQGYGNCAAAAPEVFDLDDTGLVEVLNANPEGPELARAREAATMCPVQAITVG